jgi:cation transport regulator ChaC
LVVTLLPYEEWAKNYSSTDPHPHDKDTELIGMLYKVGHNNMEAVKSHLDHREKDGYNTQEVDVAVAPGIFIKATIYIANSNNPSFIQGDKSISRLAHIICQSEGESGHNIEYLFELAKGKDLF